MVDEARVDAIVASWLERRERGDSPDPGAVIRDHPQFAGPLQRRFAALQLVDLAFTDAPRPSDVPARIGPFEIEELLGTGGMGSVFRARVVEPGARLVEGQEVALKIVHPHLMQGGGFFKRFLREAELGRRVDHENVVRTLDVDAREQEGRHFHYLVMEYVEGQTLRDLREELERAPEELCRHIGREVAKGLAAIHAAGVVHRDLKPENVIITSAHEVKVMDLGVARRLEQTRLSQTGTFVGSLAYAAPEQLADPENVDARADLHALGLVLYELATGVNPYDAPDARSVMRKVLDAMPRRCSELNPQLSPFFEEVVHTLLAKKREERFDSAQALVLVLEEGERSAWWKERAKSIRAATNRPLRRIRIPRETALYGREADLAKLRALYEKAKSGEGQVLLVEGEAGIGKSRLLDEFVGLLQRDGDGLNFLWGGYPPGGAATASGAFSTAYREHFGSEALEETLSKYLGETPILVPAFAALLRGEPASPGAGPLTKDSLQTVFVHATRALGRERSTIVLIEDLHFAPEAGRALFASLALAVPGQRVLLVGTTRPGVDEKWLADIQRVGAQRMPLARLGPKDLARLLADAFQSERLAEELGVKIAVKSDGNPFFVFEIIRGLREGQFITKKDDGTWVTTRDVGELLIPSSVLDLVNARIADLSEEERDLLDVAACRGFEFDPVVVAQAAGIGVLPALKRLALVERRHRLVRASGDRYVFDHHQVQEALYASLANPLRQAYHAAIAGALESRHAAANTDPKSLDGALCVDLAELFLKGAQGPRAARYLDAALTHLETGWLNDQAVRLAEHALAAPGLLAGKERAEILLRMAARLGFLGRHEAERAALDEARSLADLMGDDALRARARTALGAHFNQVARFAEAESSLREALDLARSAGDRKEEVRATRNLGNVCWCLGRFAEAREHHDRCLALAKEIGDRREEAAATGNLGTVLRSLSRYDEAREHYDRQLALARDIGDRNEEAAATGNLGLVSSFLGRFADAMAYHERRLVIAREIGDRRGETSAAGNLGTIFVFVGRFAEAREHLERDLVLAREIGDRKLEATGTGNLGIVLSSLGRYAEAREHFERGLALAREIGDRPLEGAATGNLGIVLFTLGRYAVAREHLERNLALSREMGYRRGEALALANLGPLHLAVGDDALARRRLDESLALSREIGARQVEGGALARLAAVADAQEDGAAAARLLEESLALRREIGDGAGVAESLTQLADLRRRAGDAEGARAAAEEALSLVREQRNVVSVAFCLALLANLPGGDVQAALAALREAGEAGDTARVRYLLWQTTRDRAHIVEAKRLLDFLVEHAPPDCRASMLANVRLHREIAAAAQEEGL